MHNIEQLEEQQIEAVNGGNGMILIVMPLAAWLAAEAAAAELSKQ